MGGQDTEAAVEVVEEDAIAERALTNEHHREMLNTSTLIMRLKKDLLTAILTNIMTVHTTVLATTVQAATAEEAVGEDHIITEVLLLHSQADLPLTSLHC